MRDWVGTGIILTLIPALLAPMLLVRGVQPTLSPTPSPATPGATVVITGRDFPKNDTGYLTFDGDPSLMPEYRTSQAGEFQASLVVPLTAAVGEHIVSAIQTPPGNRGNAKSKAVAAGAAVIATVALAIGVPQPTPTPIPSAVSSAASPTTSTAASSSALPSPTATATATSTAPATMAASPSALPSASTSASTAPAATPAPTPAPAAGPPQGGIFAYYYLWWSSRHWQDKLGPNYPYANNPWPLPATIARDGCTTTTLYAGNQLTDVPTSMAAQDQDIPASVERDVRNAVSAGLTGFFVNWIGTGLPNQGLGDISYSRRLQYVIDAAHKVTAEGTPFFVVLSYRGSVDPLLTTSQVTNDFEYLRRMYAGDPALFRPYGDRPLLVWEASRKYPIGTISAVSPQFRPDFFMMADEDANTWAGHAAHFDGATRYFSTQQVTASSFSNMKLLGDQVHASAPNPDGTRKLWYSSFTPGHNSFLLTGSTNCTPRNDGQTMVDLFNGNAASNPDGWALISWNEIAEGTYVLPLQRFGTRYLEVLRQLAGGS